MTAPELPPLPEPAVTGIGATRHGLYSTGEPREFSATQMREYAMLERLAERERIIEEIEDLRANGEAVNLTAGEIMRNEIVEDLLNAIRSQGEVKA